VAYESTDNPLNRLFDLFERRQELKAQGEAQQRELSSFTDQFPRYGVDEYGRVFLRGEASASMPGGAKSSMQPLALIGIGVLAVALVVYARKR